MKIKNFVPDLSVASLVRLIVSFSAEEIVSQPEAPKGLIFIFLFMLMQSTANYIYRMISCNIF